MIRGFNPEAERRRRALEQASQRRGTGFVPQQPGQTMMPQRDPNFRQHNLGGQRYGQQQGFGQGYIPSRSSLGGQHLPAQERMQRQRFQGYNPRTAGRMWGGRPTGYRPPQMQQPQAITRPQTTAGAYLQRPQGGYPAVQRRPQPQQYRRW